MGDGAHGQLNKLVSRDVVLSHHIVCHEVGVVVQQERCSGIVGVMARASSLWMCRQSSSSCCMLCVMLFARCDGSGTLVIIGVRWER